MPTKKPIGQRITSGFIKAFGLNKKVQKEFNQGRNKRRQQKQDQINSNKEAKARKVTPIHVSYKLKF